MTDPEFGPEDEALLRALAATTRETPPPRMLARFRTRLAAERAPLPAPPRRYRMLLAAAAAVTILLGGGWLLEWRQHRAEVTTLRRQLADAVTDLSEVNRLRAIATATRAGVHDREIVEAFRLALLTDPNTNVRVAAIEGLIQLASTDELLAASLPAARQDRSIFVQTTLLLAADRLEPAARRQLLDALLGRPDLDGRVRAAARERLAS